MYKTTTHHSRRVRIPPTPTTASNKRKEREVFDPSYPSKPPLITKKPRPPHAPQAVDPAPPNQLILAGYLAHEYLESGTLFGQPWDPDRAEPDPSQIQNPKPTEEEAEPEGEKQKIYVEVASLLKMDGAHLPNIVNPTQLARFLRTTWP